jgi:hypothetical protein
VVRRPVVKEEPGVDRMDARRAGRPIKDEGDSKGDKRMESSAAAPNVETKLQGIFEMDTDNSDDSELALLGPSRVQKIIPTDVKPVIRRGSASTSKIVKKTQKRTEPYVPKGTIIDIESSPEPGDNAGDPITISD